MADQNSISQHSGAAEFVTMAQFSELVSSIQFQLTLMVESLRTFIQAAQAIPVVNSSLVVFPARGKQTQNKKRKFSPQQTAPKPKKPALPAFSMSLPDILTAIQTKPFFYRPLPFRSAPAQRNQTWFCLYHNRHGHQTDHFRALKDFLEGLH